MRRAAGDWRELGGVSEVPGGDRTPTFSPRVEAPRLPTCARVVLDTELDGLPDTVRH